MSGFEKFFLPLLEKTLDTDGERPNKESCFVGAVAEFVETHLEGFRALAQAFYDKNHDILSVLQWNELQWGLFLEKDLSGLEEIYNNNPQSINAKENPRGNRVAFLGTPLGIILALNRDDLKKWVYEKQGEDKKLDPRIEFFFANTFIKECPHRPSTTKEPLKRREISFTQLFMILFFFVTLACIIDYYSGKNRP